MAPVIALSAVTTVILCLYVGAGVYPSGQSEFVLKFAWVVVVLLWMEADARRLRRLPCYDFAFLAMIFFPVSLLWYCLSSRRWRGVLFFLALLGLWLTPYIIAEILAVMVAP